MAPGSEPAATEEANRPLDAERHRLADPEWQRWGPYLAERAWGTVREDYSADGEAWRYFPHEQARSRAYRWSEDGLGGICDELQNLCFAFAFWNGRDPFLKERIFGLTGEQGNHGEDAKEYWWYLDSTPTHSWMRWRYVYPQAAFPYDDLVAENARRDRTQPEYELLDTGVFQEDRYFEITVDYAKAGPEDVCMRVSVRNAGPEQATLHLLPTLWFRNRWSWAHDVARPQIRAGGPATLTASDELTAAMQLSGSGDPGLLFCENDTNTQLLWQQPGPAYPKDGIGDHVIRGLPSVNPAATGTKAALHYVLSLAPGETQEIRLRLSPTAGELNRQWQAALSDRQREADEFYASLAEGASDSEREVMRQAFAGMLWGKQFYHYDVNTWLDGDPAQPPPPASRLNGRNADWRHLDSRDVISMPDKWEYPWFAVWDLAFHCITLAHVDPQFAKEQLRLVMREWYMHPSGKLPAYEWNFSDVNPPVYALATLAVYRIDHSRDRAWLVRMFHKLLINFTWWANVKDIDGGNLFGGGFLGMDNVGPFDRSSPLPDGLQLEQSDGTAWMALYCLAMLEMALVLARDDHAYEDVAVKFFEHFTLISGALEQLWDEADGFYYDTVRRPSDGATWPVRVRSMTGLLPLCAVAAVPHGAMDGLEEFRQRVAAFLKARPECAETLYDGEGESFLLAAVRRDRLARIVQRLLDEHEFLSPHGLRALSAAYRDAPFEFWVSGEIQASVDYEPAESTTPLFGGNSNWRGPIWFPVNYLVIDALDRFGARLGEELTAEFPRGSGRQLTLSQVADELSDRLVSIFLPDGTGQRPVFGSYQQMPADWVDSLPFHEYFHGDTGAGLGASHQTGWTGLVANLVLRQARRRAGRSAQEPTGEH
jgi:hypothetical protein